MYFWKKLIQKFTCKSSVRMYQHCKNGIISKILLKIFIFVWFSYTIFLLLHQFNLECFSSNLKRISECTKKKMKFKVENILSLCIILSQSKWFKFLTLKMLISLIVMSNFMHDNITILTPQMIYFIQDARYAVSFIIISRNFSHFFIFFI